VADGKVVLSDGQWEIWIKYYLNQINNLLNKEGEWEPATEVRRIFEH
jgi:hypothetical protein